MKPYFDTIDLQGLIIAQAKSWLNTPYQHLGKTKGGGVDCAHFVGGVYKELCLISKIEDSLYYAQDWYLHSQREILFEGIDRHFREYGLENHKIVCFVYYQGFALAPGDILCIKLAGPNVPYHHSALYIAGNFIIHALERTGVVIDQFVNDWPKKTGCIFRLMEKK